MHSVDLPREVRAVLIPFLALLAALEDSGLSLDQLVDLEVVPAVPPGQWEVALAEEQEVDSRAATMDSTKVEIIRLFPERRESTTRSTRRSPRLPSTARISNGPDTMRTWRPSVRSSTFAR